MKSVLIITATVVIVVVLMLTRPDSQAELQPLPPARVITDLVRQMDVRPESRIKGKLQPARRASLRMEVSGTVTARAVEPGQTVAAGDVLLAVDDADFRDTAIRARAMLQQEEEALERDKALLSLINEEIVIQQREVQRMEQLGRDSLASKSSYDAAMRLLLQLREQQTQLQFSINSAQPRLAIQRAELSHAERNLQRSRLQAPYRAIVNAVSVDVGDYIAAGQVALDLVQIDELDLYIEVTGEVARGLELGEEITLTVEGVKHRGVIHAMAPDPDPLTHTHALRIRMPADDLFPGQLAEAILPGETLPGVTVVPISAILREEGQAYVFTVAEDTLQRNPVTLLARQSDTQVIDGVAAGTRIVTRDVSLLADGQQVSVKH